MKDFLEEITELFDKGFIAKEENDLPKKIEYSEDIFFGTIYLTNTRINGEFQFKEVIDGQQRITTWYLFLLASFSLLDEYKEIYIKENNVSRFKKQFKEFYFYIRKLLFYNSDKPNFEVKYEHLKYVTHQKDDKDVWELLFKELIPKKNDNSFNLKDKDLKKARKTKVYKAYNQIKEFLSKLIEKLDNEEVVSKHEHFLRPKWENDYGEKYHKTFVVMVWLFYKIVPNFKFAIFELANEDKAPKIFETIKAKGLQLSAFDIIKNNIYKYYAEQKIDKFETDIADIEKNCYVL
ncbi:GmrSD restriction endonuclease domain-containing protein [Spiroplasma endosymbiont of Eupeodes luniger]|uniref:GmrSD restriction endonuclease domain-containing protein n=1 Tax=Spiroplasma endosymbiont of Eupeodes luniger TaxID=3066300 RepID=UPI0030D1FA8D